MLTNTQLETIIFIMFLIICLRAFWSAIERTIYNVYWHKQIAGDDFDEEGYCINQENPFYHE